MLERKAGRKRPEERIRVAFDGSLRQGERETNHSAVCDDRQLGQERDANFQHLRGYLIDYFACSFQCTRDASRSAHMYSVLGLGVHHWPVEMIDMSGQRDA